MGALASRWGSWISWEGLLIFSSMRLVPQKRSRRILLVGDHLKNYSGFKEFPLESQACLPPPPMRWQEEESVYAFTTRRPVLKWSR